MEFYGVTFYILQARPFSGHDVDPDRGNGDDDVETVGRRRRVSWRGHLGDCIAPVVSKMSAILFY